MPATIQTLSAIMCLPYPDLCLHFNLLHMGCRVKQGLSSSPQYPQVLKKNEQMYALLAVVLALCPAAQGSLEESVTSQLREKCVPALTLGQAPSGHGEPLLPCCMLLDIGLHRLCLRLLVIFGAASPHAPHMRGPLAWFAVPASQAAATTPRLAPHLWVPWVKWMSTSPDAQAVERCAELRPHLYMQDLGL